MKLLLIHTAEEKAVVSQLEQLLKNLDIGMEILPLESPEDINIKAFTAFFKASDSENEESQESTPTNVLVLSSLSSTWFDFLAGFSFGSHVPILIYGQEAIPGISNEFASFFTFLATEVILQTFLAAEYEAVKKQMAARETIKAQETLVRMGVPVTVESLAQCVADGRTHEATLFLAAGFSPDTRNKAGVPLICIAARSGNVESLRFLISAGAQLNLQADDRGTSALVDSVMAKHYDVMMELIQAGADLNIQSKDGQTALVVAAGASIQNMVEALLKAGADADISDCLGVSARKYAALFHNSDMMELFDTYAPQKRMI